MVRDVVPMADGFALVGIAEDADRLSGWIGGVDAVGRSRWHHIERSGRSTLVAGSPAGDDGDGLVAAGVTNLAGRPSEPEHADPYVLHAGPDGAVPWIRTYQPDAPDGGATAITAVSDGYVLGGTVEVGTDERVWAAHLDTNGTRSWQWRGDRTGSVNSALKTPGGVIVAGSAWPPESDAPEPRGRQEAAWITKLDDGGEADWEWGVDRDAGDRIEDVALGPAGGVVAVGRRGFSTDDRGVGWLVALDADGRRRWERTYPQDGWNWLHTIASVETGYVLGGTRAEDRNAEASDRGAWLLHVDGEGRIIWDYQADPGSAGYAVQPLADGGLLVGGSKATGTGDVAWLAKVGGEGGQRTIPDPFALTPPDWLGPAIAGGVLGLLGSRAVTQWRQS